ncbi:hypothetical protein [Abyssicoccus albus]|uniref:Uncharacterized protein n=1 Tax=Abyssicoccus albus TaxID=1817405 RepID=A0A3N5BAH2_9BACL|nr:hypothetical protein [Abyssicoccus albus]RPF54766.1 hypothetical protein EDD62_1727 [Abyssicoccus albus]
MNNDRDKDVKIAVSTLLALVVIVVVTVMFSVVGTAVVTLFTPTSYWHDLKIFTVAVMAIQYVNYTLKIAQIMATENYYEQKR